MKCKIEGKYCDLVIPGDSYDNLVSTEVVQKMNLKCAPNTKAYRVSWL